MKTSGLVRKFVSKKYAEVEVHPVIPVVHNVRKRKYLAEILEAARKNGTWNGLPAEITAEDREWLDSPSVGEEVIKYE